MPSRSPAGDGSVAQFLAVSEMNGQHAPPTGDHQGRPYISWRCVMSLREAIESYHELLTDELVGDSQAKLDDQQQSRGITFGGRPLCSVLRPRFMTPEQYRFLQTRVRLLLHAFDKIYYR